MSLNQSLPKFNKPPVVEMVLGVEFAQLIRWSIPHYGLFWAKIRDQYQHYSVREPLISQIETFGGQGKQEITLEFPIVGPPPIRCWYANDKQDWLIQVQQDRFIQNWRKRPPNASYSHYSLVRERFESELQRFREFVKAEEIGELHMRQCEVTYFNHIEPAEGQSINTAMSDIFPCWAGDAAKNELPSPESAALNAGYVIPENRGRMHISVQPVFRHSDAKDILQMTVSTKVIPTGSDLAAVLEALDLGHEWAVKGFAEFTSAKIHDFWERKQ